MARVADKDHHAILHHVRDLPSTLYERIYRLFLPGHPADRVNMLLLKYPVQRPVGQWTQVLQGLYCGDPEDCAKGEAPGIECEGGLGATVCNFEREGTRLEVPESQ